MRSHSGRDTEWQGLEHLGEHLHDSAGGMLEMVENHAGSELVLGMTVLYWVTAQPKILQTSLAFWVESPNPCHSSQDLL